jgi:hypothetical protein
MASTHCPCDFVPAPARLPRAIPGHDRAAGVQHFQRLAQGIDVQSALNSILRQAELWKDNRITLRSHIGGAWQNWFCWDMLGELTQFVFAIMTVVKGESLGHVLVVRLPAGESYELDQRDYEHYALVLGQDTLGLHGEALGESTPLCVGDMWWLRNGAQIVNNTQSEVVMLVIEARPHAAATYVPQ